MSPTRPPATVDARIRPLGRTAVFSREEIALLADTGPAGLHALARNCVLAVLNTGNADDDPRRVLARHADFEFAVQWHDGGLCVDLRAAPGTAFVEGVLIRGIQEHLFAVLRDLVYAYPAGEAEASAGSDGATDYVFGLLRHAGVLRPHAREMVVCWGGHAISREEYDYSKVVGYELGLRGVDICTGCGPGAMKGPMKGAAVGHAKQRMQGRRYLGLTEPGIIAAEPPNPIVNELAVLPDIEKRLEAFLRVGHAIVVFPGGVGTAEELLYVLGILLHPENAGQPLPLLLTGPTESAAWFQRLDTFIGATLGPQAQACYEVFAGDSIGLAQRVRERLNEVAAYRSEKGDAAYFNWRLRIAPELQTRFVPTHQNMAALDLRPDAPLHLRVANLRRALSGIVAGNVKESGIAAVERYGPFELRGDPAMLRPLDTLLEGFVAEHRMRLPGNTYHPCYRIVA